MRYANSTTLGLAGRGIPGDAVVSTAKARPRRSGDVVCLCPPSPFGLRARGRAHLQARGWQEKGLSPLPSPLPQLTHLLRRFASRCIIRVSSIDTLFLPAAAGPPAAGKRLSSTTQHTSQRNVPISRGCSPQPRLALPLQPCYCACDGTEGRSSPASTPCSSMEVLGRTRERTHE